MQTNSDTTTIIEIRCKPFGHLHKPASVHKLKITGDRILVLKDGQYVPAQMYQTERNRVLRIAAQ